MYECGMIDDMMEVIAAKMVKILKKMTEVRSEDLGLDRRAACRMWICEDGIIVNKSLDNSLQYYGGFEYIEKEYRTEIGEWVIYAAGDGDSRVDECLEYYNSRQADEQK